MSVSAVHSTSPAMPAAPVPASAPGPEHAPLLPEPSAGALAGADPLSVMYLFESKDQNDDVTNGTGRVRSLETERAHSLQKELDAIKQEDDAIAHKSFWDNFGGICGEIAKVAGVVASVAAAVATCGAATPLAAVAIAGAALSTAAFADGELHVLRSFGVDDKIAGMVDLGMSLGGAACSVGVGLLSKGVSTTVSVVSRTAAVVNGMTAAGGAVSTVEAGREQADIDRADANQVVASAMSDHLLRTIQGVIDEVQDSDTKSKQVMKTIVSTKTMENDTASLAAGSIRG